MSDVEQPDRYTLSYSDQASQELDHALLFVQRTSGPRFASHWLTELVKAIQSIPEPVGPRAHAIDEEATRRYGMEVRRKLYYGPGSRRSRTPYRILFLIIPSASSDEEEGIIIRILRILHGSQALDPDDTATAGDDAPQ